MSVVAACQPKVVDSCLAIGDQTYVKFAFAEQLPTGITMTGTPVVTEKGDQTVQITLPQVNSEIVTFDDNTEHAAGTVVIARIKVIDTKMAPTVLKATCGTTDGWLTVSHEMQFRTRP